MPSKHRVILSVLVLGSLWPQALLRAATPPAPGAEPAAAPAAAAGAPAAPAMLQRPTRVHHFMDKENVSLHSFNFAMMLADVATTQRALQVPGTRELNPLAKSPSGLVALKVAGFTAGLSLAYMLHQTGHHKAERFIPLVFGIPSGAAAAHNAGIHR